jgi:hypothetical protein
MQVSLLNCSGVNTTCHHGWVRRQEALVAMFAASIAGLVVAPIGLLLIEIAMHHVSVAETFGGALFAVLFFASTSITVALHQNEPSLMRAVLTSYVIKTVVIFLAASFLSFDSLDRDVAGMSIAVSAFSYLIVQTLYVARRKGRIQRRIDRLS